MSKHRRPGDRRPGLVLAALAVAGVTLLGASGPAMAARGGGGKPTGGSTSSSSSLKLVLLDSTDGLAHWGQRVTFDVSTTATAQPNVELLCSQGGTTVYSSSAGFYDGYPWPWTTTMTLSSQMWTGGDASCTARLYMFARKGTTTLATLSFPAYA